MTPAALSIRRACAQEWQQPGPDRIGDRDGWVRGIRRDPGRPVHRPVGAVTILASDLALEDVPPGEQAEGPWEEIGETTRHYDPHGVHRSHRAQVLWRHRRRWQSPDRAPALQSAQARSGPAVARVRQGEAEPHPGMAHPCPSRSGDAQFPCPRAARPPGEFLAGCLRHGWSSAVRWLWNPGG